MIELRPWQKRFVARALSPAVDTAALSIPRGNGKTALAAHILTRALTPGDKLNVPGCEYLLCAASIEQARLTFRFIRADLEALPGASFRFLDSNTRIGLVHTPSNTRLRVLSSNGKTSMGIVNCPLLVADEPGSWEANGGTLMYDAITTAQGKPDSPLRVIFIGTLAPASSGWWHTLVEDGSHGSTHVQALRGDAKLWDKPSAIRKANPLMWTFEKSRKKLLAERDAARRDSRLRARFLSYRLNRPAQDEAKVLLTVDDWERSCARPVPPREGRPLCGVDLGAGRAWSACVAIWRNGRTEAYAIAPGLPDIEQQERRDRVPRGTYQKLVDAGLLCTDPDRRVPRVTLVVDQLTRWNVEACVMDRFRLPELADCTGGRIRLLPRLPRWSEAASDIRDLRRMAKDGPLAVEQSCRPLIEASLAVARVRNDDMGSFRLIKRDPSNNSARDDVAEAFKLAAGLVSRAPAPPSQRPLRICA